MIGFEIENGVGFGVGASITYSQYLNWTNYLLFSRSSGNWITIRSSRLYAKTLWSSTMHPSTSIYIHLHLSASIYIHLHPSASIGIHRHPSIMYSLQSSHLVWTHSLSEVTANFQSLRLELTLESKQTLEYSTTDRIYLYTIRMK